MGDVMHEISIAVEILKIVEAAAQEAGMNTVKKIKVVVGNDRMVIPESLLFAFTFIKIDSIAHTAILEVVSIVGRDLFIDYVEGD